MVNKRQLEEILGYSHETLTQWQGEGMPMARQSPRGEANEYDTVLVIAWLIERAERKLRAESPRDRLARVQAERIELENDEKRKVLVPVDQVEPMWRSRVLTAAAFLMAEPSRLASMLQGVQTLEGKREILRQEFIVFLTKLGGHGERFEAELLAFLSDLQRLAPTHAASLLSQFQEVLRDGTEASAA